MWLMSPAGHPALLPARCLLQESLFVDEIEQLGERAAETSKAQ
jgi:hypothetical protein